MPYNERDTRTFGLLCPLPGDLPDPGIKPVSLMSPALAGGFFTTEPRGKPIMCFYSYLQSSFLYMIKHLGFALIVICSFPKSILSSPEILGLNYLEIRMF